MANFDHNYDNGSIAKYQGARSFLVRLESLPRENVITGRITHGTFRTQDLVEAYMEVLQEHAPDVYSNMADEFAEAFGAYPCAFEDDSVVWYTDWVSSWLNDDIFDAMCEIAPPGFYFGATEGDGSDIGYWRCPDDEEEEDTE